MNNRHFGKENRHAKPIVWIILTAVVAAVAVAVGFLTNPTDKTPPDGTYRRESTVCIVDNRYLGSYGISQYRDWRVDDGMLYCSDEGESEWRQVGELQSVKLTKDNFDRYTDESLRNEEMQPYWVGAWQQKKNAAARLRRSTKRAWRCEDTEYKEFVYLLEFYGGDFYAAYGENSGEGDVLGGEFVITALTDPVQDAPPPTTGMYELSELVCYLDDGDKPNGEFSLFLDNGMLYICRDTDKSKLGQLQSVTLTKENFDSFFKSPDADLGTMVWNTDSSAAELRESTAHAWRYYVTTEGHPRYYFILQMKNGEFVYCSGIDDTAIHNFFSVYKIQPVEGFCATVLEADKITSLVEPFEGTAMRRVADKIEVPIAHLSLLYPTPAVPELYEGDQVWIQYSGEVQETYPARLSGVVEAVMIIVGHRDPATVNPYALSVMSADHTYLEKVFTRDESDANSYNVYYYAASSVTVTLDGEPMELKTALADGEITAAELLTQADRDANVGVCRKEVYDDGGSVEYRYGGYGLLRKYTTGGSGEGIAALFDVYVMPNGVSLNTLNDLLSDLSTTTHTKPDTCKVNPTVILAIEGNTVIVDAAEHYIHRNDGRYQLFDRYAFDVSGKANIRDFKVGDKVNVIHTGEFTEDDPPSGHLLTIKHIE